MLLKLHNNTILLLNPRLISLRMITVYEKQLILKSIICCQRYRWVAPGFPPYLSTLSSTSNHNKAVEFNFNNIRVVFKQCWEAASKWGLLKYTEGPSQCSNAVSRPNENFSYGLKFAQNWQNKKGKVNFHLKISHVVWSPS